MSIGNTVKVATDFVKNNPELVKTAVAGIEGLVSMGSRLLADLKAGTISQEEFVAQWNAVRTHVLSAEAGWAAAAPADTIQGAPV